MKYWNVYICGSARLECTSRILTLAETTSYLCGGKPAHLDVKLPQCNLKNLYTLTDSARIYTVYVKMLLKAYKNVLANYVVGRVGGIDSVGRMYLDSWKITDPIVG